LDSEHANFPGTEFLPRDAVVARNLFSSWKIVIPVRFPDVENRPNKISCDNFQRKQIKLAQTIESNGAPIAKFYFPRIINFDVKLKIMAIDLRAALSEPKWWF
jgi:hypothetical protein